MTHTAPRDDRAVQRLRRILLIDLGLLAVVGLCLGLGMIWVGFSWFVAGLLVFCAIIALSVARLLRRFT